MARIILRSFVVALLAGSLAAPGWGDTLVLRNGDKLTGKLQSANTSTIVFRDRDGKVRRFAVSDVEAVRFGDEPYDNGGEGRGDKNRPPDDRNRPPDDNRNPDNGRPPSESRGLSPDMEKVVLPAGTEVAVRTNEAINARDVVEGQGYSAEIAEDVRDPDGYTAIPRGSEARLVVRRMENNGDLILDLESVTVQGRRYAVGAADVEESTRREGLGANKRTGEMVGGGAILGTIIGAIAGGGKGAAIGAVAGGATGATAEALTRGKEIRVPAESLIRFRLDRPLRLRLMS